MRGRKLVFLLAGLFWVAHSESTEPVRSKGAEFVVEESVLQQLRFTQKQTTPFTDEGHVVTPNLDVTVTPILSQNVQGSSVVRLNLALSGTTSSGETQSVGRRGRKQVSVSVTNQMSGNFEQDVYVDSRGLSPAETRGGVQATTSISTSNNFRLLNGVVNKIALKKANAMLAIKMPQKLAEADQKVSGTMRGAVEQAGESLSRLLTGAEQMLPGKLPKGVYAAFDSQGGGNGRLLSQVIDTHADRKPEPAFDLKGQSVTRTVIHQDLLNDLMNQQLAGRELKFSEFQKELCGKLGTKALDFCNADLPDDVKSTSVQFSKPKAVEFFFEKGKFRFRMHALYKKRNLATVNASTAPGLGTPDSTGVSMATEPYTVDVTYKLGETGGDLVSLKVGAEERPAPPPSPLSTVGGMDKKKPDGFHLPSTLNRFREVLTEGTVGLVTKNELEKKFKQLFKPKVTVSPVSFPLKVHSVDNGPPTLVEAGTLFPLELKAEDGWLAVSTTLCSESYLSLGITPTLVQMQPGGPTSLYVSNVAPFSPAWSGAFLAGDRIESYGAPGERATTLMLSVDDFVTFTKKRAAGAGATSRTVEISGTDAAGAKFKRSVALCPGGYDHRGHAQANFTKLVTK